MPDDGVTDTLDADPVPVVFETVYPVGAVTVILLVPRLTPVSK